MFTRKSNGWQFGVLAVLLLATCPVWGQDGAMDGKELAAGPALKVEAPPVNIVAAPNDAKGSERIQLTFGESEKDLLTRAAVEKLDAPIESLEFSNADLKNVIRIIGERLNINFIFDAGDIGGNITLRLRNVRLRDALDSILKTRKLAIIVDPSGIFRIVPQEQINRSVIETRTEVIQLNWIRAEDVATTMKPFLSSDKEGRLVPNMESNTVIITDVPPQIEVIRKLIEKIDIPERQVGIEARLVDVNIGALRNLSSNISVSKTNEVRDRQAGAPGYSDLNQYGLDALGVVNNLIEGASVKSGMGTLALGDTIGIFGQDYAVNAVFTALENRDIVEILANPRVTTLNNVPANIDIVEEIPYISAAQVNNGVQTNTVEFRPAGIKILCRPIITPNDYVRMEIELDQKIFRKRVGSSNDDLYNAPQIDERKAKTNVIVRTGETAVLGGLRQQNKNESISGVPFLHRVPLLGWLFKDKRYNQTKTELILMMTPTIIRDNHKLTEKEQKFYNKIDTNWNIPDYNMEDVSTLGDLKAPNAKKAKK
ncbi:hypothetical protein LLG95_00760 [bacterium]|nr:hypothetical protein [bacterium]